MGAGIYNIELNQNATFKSALTITDSVGNYIDISGWVFKSSIRENLETDEVTDFNVSIVSAPSGTVEMLLPDVSSSLLTSTRYVYDLIAKNNNVSPPETYRIVQGTIKVSLAVTEIIE